MHDSDFGVNGRVVQCGLCRHFCENPSDGSEGFCHRYPPSVFPFPVGSVVGGEPKLLLRMFHPIVRFDERCGEFVRALPTKSVDANQKTTLKLSGGSESDAEDVH